MTQSNRKSREPIDYRRIFEASPSPYLIMGPDLTILAVNDAYLKATMTRREDIVGRGIFEVFPDNPEVPDSMAVRDVGASLARVKETRMADILAILKYYIPKPPSAGGGFEERYWSTVNSPVFDDSGTLVYILHRAEDVTEFVRSRQGWDGASAQADRLETELFLRNREISALNERLRLANSELARFDRVKTEFFQNISHEFRTPLTLLLGPLEQLLSAPERLAEEQRTQVGLAHRNALRLLRLVNTLLDFVRAESGRTRAYYEPTDLAGLTCELASTFRSAIERAGLGLLVHCPPLPEWVYVDRGMWETIVLNLLSNALKFTRQGEIAVTLKAQGDHAELSVRDTGVGIPEAELPLIFERFHRIKEAGARTNEGTGIGLALIKELVALHKGTIRAESVYGRGSTFVVEIPFGVAHLSAGAVGPESARVPGATPASAYVQEALTWLPEDAPADEVPDARAGMARPRILLVDDNADMRGYVARLLGGQYQVESVADAAAALASLRERPPDLVVTDIMMTGMSGLELLRTIRQDPALAALPVVVVSGSGGTEAVVEGLAAGADDYLVKPFQGQELLARVAAQLAQAGHIRRERELRQETEAVKSRLDMVLESVSDAVLGVSDQGRITYLNTQATRRARRPKERLIDADLSAVFPGQDGALVRENLARVFRDKLPTRLEHPGQNGGNWFETRIFPTPSGAVIFSADISRRKQAERQLREALARLRMASEIAELGFWEWEIGSDSVYFSPEWKKQLGYTDAGLPNRIEVWKSRLHPEDKDRVLQQIAHFAQAPSPNFEIEYRLAHKDGGYRWINARWMVLDGSDSRRLAITHLDVTSKKQEDERLRYVASHDALTGLPNRLMLHEFATHTLSACRRSGLKMAVLFFDLDRFKAINDTYGHKMGDLVLQEAARRIVHSLRAEDVVGRLGGDEFVAVLAEITEREDIVRVATHIIDALSHPYLIDTLELTAPPSVGISLFPDDGGTIDTLIQHADQAMYQAKASGGGGYRFFSGGDHGPPLSRSAIEERMKRDMDNQGFELVYQPIFDSGTNAVVAVEALLRWPTMNLAPVDFLPIAELSGLIHPLGAWTLKGALGQLSEWIGEGLPPVPVAINVSPVQFFGEDFSGAVARAIADSGMAGTQVHLEIPEAAVVDHADRAEPILNELKRMGVKISLDECVPGVFGQAQLSRLPVDALKVDVQRASPEQAETLFGLGRNLGLNVIAERVESAVALDFWRAREYGQVQGYELCRPLHGRAFADWYARRAAA